MAQTQEPSRPQLVPPRSPNPFGPEPSRQSLVSVEQQRAVAEIQAKLVVARASPRDQVRAVERIINSCTRPGLARAATYAYARGGNPIGGPTIRLLETAMQGWGNIECGVIEVSRHGDHSECIAYAWDLENNVRDIKEFQVKHWRDTKQGGHTLTDERDIYELIANFGARRKRACLQAVIPGDVIEAALEQCEKTLLADADVSPEGIKKLLAAFAELGVTQPQIEARIQRRADAIRPAQVVQMRGIYNSIRDGMSTPRDWFEAAPLDEVAPPLAEPSAAPPPAEPPRARRQRARHVPNPEPAPEPPPQEQPAPGRSSVPPGGDMFEV